MTNLTAVVLTCACGRGRQQCSVGRWVYEQLWGPSSQFRGEEQRLVEYGRLEVDGPPPDGRERWGRHDLQGGVTDLSGHRHVSDKVIVGILGYG